MTPRVRLMCIAKVRALLISGVGTSASTRTLLIRPAMSRSQSLRLEVCSAPSFRLGIPIVASEDFTVLFSHGNAEDIGDDESLLERIRAAGFAVFAYDYQGYGTSEGRPSERHAYEDELAAYNFLLQSMHVPGSRIIALGRSVGSGPACDLASRHPVAGLILESAFTSA